MRERSRYVFSAALAGVALSGIPALQQQAQADTVAQFTFEAFTSGGSTTGAAFTGYVADSGSGTALGVHVASTAVFSSPTGNGSLRSLSSNGWTLGDYYEFDVPTVGFQDLIVSFDTTASGTGPKAFNFLYSTDGTNFSTFGTYTVTTTPAWSSSTSNAAFNVSFDLSGISGLDNNPFAKFRVVHADATATAAAGTNRIDNFTVSSVPEPAALSVTLMTAAAGLVTRRRRD